MSTERCKVYWGSHGCHLARGHAGQHDCQCCDGDEHRPEHLLTTATGGSYLNDEGFFDTCVCVATWPYYGPDTRFYGDDARPDEFRLLSHDPLLSRLPKPHPPVKGNRRSHRRTT